MDCTYKGVGGREGGGGCGGGGWEARGGLYLPIGLFEVAMSPRTTGHRPRQAWRAKKTSHYHRGEYQTHTSYLVPSMGPTVSIMTSHGQQNPL